MKKTIALMLCILTLAAAFAGCAQIKQEAEDKGAELPVYLSTEIFTLDPAYAYLDEASVKIMGLLYEGLFTMGSDGKPVKALCKSYKSGTDRDGNFYMEFTINDTKWNDGRSVSANDFVYAWKRLLEPEFTSEAAAMLFDIKNARACKDGLVSIDDLGVVASESQVVTVTFERVIDEGTFIEYLCSPALVPLREDKADRLDDWGSYYATLATNGPFYPKTFEPGTGLLVLERSIYYYRDMESETQKLDVYVRPYELKFYLVTPEEALEMYKAGELVYDSELPVGARAEYASSAVTQNTMATATVALNNAKAPFDNADVRRALSMAIDRAALAEKLTFAEPAAGIVPEGVFETTNKTSFRAQGGQLIAPSADLSAAKSLLSGAGVTGGSFTLKIRDNQNDRAIADYLCEAWGELGFTVEVETVGYKSYTSIDYPQYTDLLSKSYYSGDFEAILIDSQALSTQAFSTLAPFATEFSGTAMDLSGMGISADTTELPIREAPVTTDENGGTAAPADSLPVIDVETDENGETAEAPDITESVDSAEPETAEPETAEPETTEPETTEPETAEPETTEPETTEAPETTTAPTPDADRAFESKPHVTGYASDAYNEIIDRAFAETDPAKRAAILHEAEQKLVEDMPVIPLIVYKDAYIVDETVNDVGTYYFAFRNFKDTTLKDYERFKDTTAAVKED